jgi:hypothetical protein
VDKGKTKRYKITNKIKQPKEKKHPCTYFVLVIGAHALIKGFRVFFRVFLGLTL